MTAKIFLDTCSIIALEGLDEKDFSRLKSQLEDSESELYSSHVQVDEKYTKNSPNFQQLCEKAFKIFEEHGIKINLGVTEGGFWDVSRWDEFTFRDDLIGIYKDLRDELEKCMKEKGKYDSKPFDEKAIINNIRDCLIAITSTNYDYFITSDCCLYRSCIKILQKNENRSILGKMPEMVYVKPHSKEILKQLLDILDAHRHNII